MFTLGHDQGAGFRCKFSGKRRMVLVCVADQDMRDAASLESFLKGAMMAVDFRSRIDDRDTVPADDIAVGAVKGQGGRHSER